jgi:hypothetical protein
MPYVPEKMASIPDLLAPGATEIFLKITHEQYKKYLQPYFGKTIDMVFCDEPSMACFTADLPKVFRQKKGYDIEPYIDLIFTQHDKDTDIKTALIRIDYAEVMTELFQKRFLAPLHKWCKKNNLNFGGHFIREDLPSANALNPYLSGGYGNILQALKNMDIPGVDTIARQIFPSETAPNGSFAKYASSVAHQSGKELAFAEIFAVYGNGITPYQMKWVADFLMVRGINKFVPAYFMQKYYDTWLSGCRPHIGPHEPMWKYMHIFHDYLSRCCGLLSQGVSANKIAFYYDIRSIWAGGKYFKEAILQHNQITKELLEKHCGFDLTDDDSIANAKITNLGLQIGKAYYTTIVLPDTQFLSNATKQKLQEFQNLGGKVLKRNELSLAEQLITCSIPAENLRVTKRLTDDKAIYFLMNEGQSNLSLQITLPEKENIAICNPLDGSFSKLEINNGTFNANFAPGESLILLTNTIADTPIAKRTINKISLQDTEWTLKEVKKYYIKDNSYKQKNIHKKAQKCTLGNWSNMLGEDFSGEAEYSCNFLNNQNQCDAQIDFGDVRYACTLYVNNKKCGERFFPPYIFDIQLKKGVNHISLQVSNTFANALSSEKLLEEWQEKYKILEYEKTQRNFEKDSLSSGLLGPVNIFIKENNNLSNIPTTNSKDNKNF